MRRRMLLAVGIAAVVAQAGAASAAPSVEIKDAVAQVTVVPENRSDVRVEVVRPNPRLPLVVRTTAMGRTVVDGGLSLRRIRNCRGTGPDVVVRVAGVGDVPAAEMPQVVIRMPRDVDVSVGGAVFGAIGRAVSVSVGNAGCGDWTIGNVERELRIGVAGSGNARAGQAGQARLRIAGAGDIFTGEVRGRLDVDVAGSGDVHARSVAGPLDVHIAGSGDVTVDGGRASAMTATIAGSGNILFGGVADTLQARIAGSGDVIVRQVAGPVRKSIIGSGSVQIR